MDDYEIKRNLWESRIPVEFAMDSDDALCRKKQSSFAMLPRMSYFSLYLPKIGHALDIKTLDDLWLQYNGKPLKWNYPIGVLYDLHVVNLPWTITIKLKEFPDELVRCQSRKALRNCFIQSLKEADQLKHKCNVAYNLTADESTRLFDSLAEGSIFALYKINLMAPIGKFDDFWAVNQKFMADNEIHSILHIPIRFYQPSKSFKQVLVLPRRPTTGDGESTDVLLRDALAQAFPEQSEALSNADASVDGFVAISHGITMPLDTPVLWLARNFAYPDNFVHVVWRRNA